MNSTKHLFLVGFSGSGKTTVGRALARKLKIAFCDTDSLVEQNSGRTISEIFRAHDESEFRKLEREVIAELTGKNSPAMVIALGGGAFQNPINRRLVIECGIVIYLSCSAREIYRRLRSKNDRPLLAGPTGSKGHRLSREVKMRKIQNLLERRRKNYEKADIKLSTSLRTIEESVNALLRKVTSCYVND